MRSFRHIFFPALLIVLGFTAVLTFGCKNKCGSTTCQNGGDCESNVCVCPEGYSGTSCQNSWSSVAVGTYNCKNENCNVAVSSVSSWQSVVTADATNGGYTIDISNFDGNNTTVVAVIDSSKHGVSQISITNSIGINAIGSYDSSVAPAIYLQYQTISNGTPGPTCNMIMTKIL